MCIHHVNKVVEEILVSSVKVEKHIAEVDSTNDENTDDREWWKRMKKIAREGKTRSSIHRDN